eukprot:scaffold231017_cov36-Tisochrysis_lutea.AAC.2
MQSRVTECTAQATGRLKRRIHHHSSFCGLQQAITHTWRSSRDTPEIRRSRALRRLAVARVCALGRSPWALHTWRTVFVRCSSARITVVIRILASSTATQKL